MLEMIEMNFLILVIMHISPEFYMQLGSFGALKRLLTLLWKLYFERTSALQASQMHQYFEIRTRSMN